MSLASSPDCLFRPEDAVLKLLFPTTQESSSLDDFLHEQLFNPSDNGDSPAIGAIIEGYSLDEDCPSISPLAKSTAEPSSTEQPWRKGLWCLNQSPRVLPAEALLPESKRSYAGIVPTTQLDRNFNPQAKTIASLPHKIPSTEARPSARTRMPSATEHCYQGRPPFCRAVTLSPSPMYASLPSQDGIQVEDWQLDFQRFQLSQPHESYPLSPPVSHTAQYQRSASSINNAVMARNAEIGLAITTEHKHTLHGTEVYHGVDPELFDPSSGVCDRIVPGMASQFQNDILGYSYPQELTSNVPWTTESVHSSSSSHPSYESNTYTSVDEQNGRHRYTPPYISSSSAYCPASSNNLQFYSGQMAAPVAQHMPHPILHVHGVEQSQAGLGIRYPQIEQIATAVPPSYPQYQYSNSAHAQLSYASYMPSSAPAPHFPHEHQPITAPQMSTVTARSQFVSMRPHCSPPRTPSPPMSPGTIYGRKMRLRSPTRSDQSLAHQRRKSIHKIGPMKDSTQPQLPPVPTLPATASPSRKTSSPNHRRNRSRSMSRPPVSRTPRTPRTPTTPGLVDFVNFTPKDSIKLLSDVAPSGSSKTRARREQEARDKRKRLSEAALKAIRRAGGDVKDFKEFELS